jgi:hypothetical protein
MNTLTPSGLRGEPFYSWMDFGHSDYYGTDEMDEYEMWQDYHWEPLAVYDRLGLVFFYNVKWIKS